MQFLARHKLDMRNCQMCLLCQSVRYFFCAYMTISILYLCVCKHTHTHIHILEFKYLGMLCASMQILLALSLGRFDLKGSDASARFPGSKEQTQMLNYLSLHSHLHTLTYTISHTHINQIKANAIFLKIVAYEILIQQQQQQQQ